MEENGDVKNIEPKNLGEIPRWLPAAFIFLIVAPIFLAIFNSLANPLFEPPDELEHYQFVRYLLDERSLPVQQLDNPPSQFHQPPLYYLIGAVLIRTIPDEGTIPQDNPHWTSYPFGTVHRDNKIKYLPDQDLSFPYTGTTLVMHVLRWWSVLLFTGTLILIWLLGREIWPAELDKRLLLLAIAGFTPMFIYMGSSVNNDNLVVFWAAFLLWLVLRSLRTGFDWLATSLIGLAWGCAILSKTSGVVLVIPWGVGLLWYSWQQKNFRYLITRALVIGLIAMGLSGWWFIRNQSLYGELTGVETMLSIWGRRLPGEFNLPSLKGALVHAWLSYWGRFGYGQIVLPDPIYAIFTILVIISLLGLFKRATTLLRQQRPRNVQGTWFILGATVLVYFAALFYFFVRNPTGANGRYIFPALPAIAALIVAGLSAIRWSRFVSAGMVILLGAIAFFSIGLFIPWTYARPALLTTQQAMNKITTPQELQWEDKIRLLGTTVAPRTVSDQPGEEVVLTACWQALAPMNQNYTFFVHLLDADFNPLGQRDTHPGLGNFPTSFWQPGDSFCEDYRVPVTPNILRAPVVAAVEIGFYANEPQNRLQGQTPFGQSFDLVIIDQLKVLATNPAEIPPPANQLEAIQFAQGISLAGYAWSAPTAPPGSEVTLRLWWRSSGPLDDQYHIFAHLLDESGRIIVQADGPPQRGRYPTNFWGGGELIIDEYTFSIPSGTSPTATTTQLGFYHPQDGRRINRVGEAELPDAVNLPGPVIGE